MRAAVLFCLVAAFGIPSVRQLYGDLINNLYNCSAGAHHTLFISTSHPQRQRHYNREESQPTMISLERFHFHCRFLVLFVLVFLSGRCDSFSWSRNIQIRSKSCALFASTTAIRTPTTTTDVKTVDGGTLTTSNFECTNVQASSRQILETLLNSRKTWTVWISPGSLIKTGAHHIFRDPKLSSPIQSLIKPNPINILFHRP